MTRDILDGLNPAQREAATAPDGPVLVIAGAGTGKTRTVVHRLAWLAGQGVEPERILLLTFTRRAAAEMARRAGDMLGQGLDGVRGGTFHSFAALVLRKNCGLLGYDDGFTILGQSEAQDVLYHAIRALGLGKKGRSAAGPAFPKPHAVLSLISTARNKELPLHELLAGEAHLAPYRDGVLAVAEAYGERKRAMGLMDYDDLLFNLDRLLTGNAPFLERMRAYVRHVLVDEYQDTNPVQARIVRHLAGEGGNVMAVGDDAQSIYGFRGADVRNILDFPSHFPGARVIRLERNYRSVQPVLDLANGLLGNAREGYGKVLTADRAGGVRPGVHRPEGDLDQARRVVARVQALARDHALHDIAVLFRAGYESFQVEIALGKASIPFQKFGGMKFTESAQVKDVVALLRLVADDRDRAAWTRAASLVGRGWGRQAEAFASAVVEVLERDVRSGPAGEDEGDGGGAVEDSFRAWPEVAGLLVFLRSMRGLADPPVAAVVNAALEFYGPILAARHPEDYPARQAALDQFAQVAQGYATLDLLLADAAQDGEAGAEAAIQEDKLVLSTVHSAKGLEWPAVLVIDLVEGCFPTRHALASPADLEEERRLLYVACTRARDRLDLYVPRTLFNRSRQQPLPVDPCPFLLGLPEAACLTAAGGGGGAGGAARAGGSGNGYRGSSGRARSGPAAGTSGGSSRNAAWGASRDGSRGEYDDPYDDGPGRSGPRFRHIEQSGPTGPSWSPGRSGPAIPSRTPAPAGPQFCSHKIFGRGQILQFLAPDKYKVEFPQFGLKTVRADYLTLEPAGGA